jgi:Na+/H+ antiporter NhaD/arsenite permease-like protein
MKSVSDFTQGWLRSTIQINNQKSAIINSSRTILLLGIELPHLRPVAALLHAAPAAVMILAGVEKQPLAGGRGAGGHVRHVARGEQIRGRATHTYANPVVAVILGWLLAREPLSMRVVLASLAILGAIMLIRRGERAVAVKAPEAVSRVEIQSSEEWA